MRKLFISIVSIVFLSLTMTSHALAERTCGTMDHLAYQMKQDPDLKTRMEEIEKFSQAYTSRQKNLRMTGTITIPVNVIVVYSNPQQNISDAQIQSQIDVLNEDYGRTNSDWSNTPSEFSASVADFEIQFNWIHTERHADSTASWGTDDAVKRAYPPTNPTTTLNIWVANIGNNTMGYAQLPGGNPLTDGVVISPQYFGSSSKGSGFYLSSPFDKGRTATHEIGHWLNLRHIWGDGDCSVDDFVSDTPSSDRPNFSCPVYPTVHCGSNDMTMNYMDYTDDACMYMFTVGQKIRSRAIFEPGGPREAFADNNSPVASTSDFSWTMFLPAILGGAQDCNGEKGGDAYLDNCGICVGGTTGKTPCTQDCSGTWGGNAIVDECGVCGGDGPPCPAAGCDGIPGSGTVVDKCGVCGGDNSTCAGCDGVPNSGLEVDECGVCGGDNSTCAGCDGVPNSGLEVDECGVCGGDGTSCCTLTCSSTGFAYSCGSSSYSSTKQYCYIGSTGYVSSVQIHYSNGHSVECQSSYCGGPLTCTDDTGESCTIQ